MWYRNTCLPVKDNTPNVFICQGSQCKMSGRQELLSRKTMINYADPERMICNVYLLQL